MVVKSGRRLRVVGIAGILNSKILKRAIPKIRG
jgi:hypothetical protein